jgi:uncharacterized protein YjbI with pentapeptide repeats
MLYNESELIEILKSHKNWFNGDRDGVKAALNCAALRRADLRGVTLRGASLRGANLSRAQLCAADLRGAESPYASLFTAST